MVRLPFTSSTRSVPEAVQVPRHIAIIMDGNGRWARKRFMPRVAGHAKGVDSLREVIRTCLDRGVEYLTVFAFSSENWRRPKDEVSFLMQLFVKSLKAEIERIALASEAFTTHAAGAAPKRVIVVPGKLVNVVG